MRPLRRQQRLKPAARAARAEVVAAKLLAELFVAMHDAHAALDGHLGGVAAAALAHRLKRSPAPRCFAACA
jgi:hypothetical protein